MELGDILHIVKYVFGVFSFAVLFKVYQFKRTKMKFEYLRKSVWVKTDAVFADAAEGVDKEMFGEEQRSAFAQAIEKYITKPATQVLYRTDEGFFTCDFEEKELVDELRECRTVLYLKSNPTVVLTPRQYKFVILRWKATFWRYALYLVITGAVLGVTLFLKYR